MFKYRVSVIIIIFIILFNYSSTSYFSDKESIINYNSVCIDAGHGGIDPGTVYNDIYEKDINLNIALFLGQLLEEEDFLVTYTRVTDTDLAPDNYKERKKTDLTMRSRIINSSDCFVYISIHLNSNPSSTYRGPQMYYEDVNDDNKIVANIMSEVFSKYISTTRLSKELTDLYLYKLIEKPGILSEVGFLSNSNDRYLLLQEDYQKKLAMILKEGIITYQTYLLENVISY